MENLNQLDKFLEKIIALGTDAGKNLLLALCILVAGRYLIRFLHNFFRRMLSKTQIDVTVQSFVLSLVNILMMLLVGVSVVGALGVNTTSFAALLASAGVAVGMALSGSLQNFAGGIIILVLRPYRAGDFIEMGSVQGTVKEIQIFHTVLTTVDNKEVYLPNGTMSSGIITNFTRTGTRRLEWIVGIDYGDSVMEARNAIEDVLKSEPRLLSEPAAYIGVTNLGDSSVDLVVHAWVDSADFIVVRHAVNEAIYRTFNERGINFPFPQQTVHVVHEGEQPRKGVEDS